MQEYSYATSIPGLIKNAEGKINGKITYARVTIRRRLDAESIKKIQALGELGKENDC
mgnify:CR=1 FL=1